MRISKTKSERDADRKIEINQLRQLQFPRRFFAWRPVRIEDGSWVWLETVWCVCNMNYTHGTRIEARYYFRSYVDADKHVTRRIEHDQNYRSWCGREFWPLKD